MRTFLVLLLLSQTALAQQLYKADGHRTVAGGGEGRTIEQWCDLAATAKSEEARVKYATTLLAIEAAPLPDATRDEIKAASSGPHWREARIEQFKKRLTKSEVAALQKAGIALTATGPKQAAICMLLPVLDEHCLPALMKITPDLSDGGSGHSQAPRGLVDKDHYALPDLTAYAIARIGGKKAVAALVATAKKKPASNLPGSGRAADIWEWKMGCHDAAINALGQMTDPEALKALQGLRRYFGAQSSEAYTIDTALKTFAERQAQADDAKALAAKPGQ